MTITVFVSVTCYLVIAGIYLLQFSTTHSVLPWPSVSISAECDSLTGGSSKPSFLESLGHY